MAITILVERMKIALSSVEADLSQDVNIFERPFNLAADATNEDRIEETQEALDQLDLIGAVQHQAEVQSILDKVSELLVKGPIADRQALADEWAQQTAALEIPTGMANAMQREKLLARQKARLERQLRCLNRSRRMPPPGHAPADIALPAQKLPTFAGDSGDLWSEFWAQYEPTVHANIRLTDAQRHIYLKGLLSGAAKDTIIGLPVDGTQYQAAIDLLTEKFGNRARRVRELHKQLLALPNCTSLAEVQRFSTELEKIARQLMVFGENVEGTNIHQQLEGKLPISMIRKIAEARKAAGAAWNTSEFRKELRELIEDELEVQQVFKQAHGEKTQRAKPSDSKSNKNPSNSTVTFTTVRDQGKTPANAQRRKPIGQSPPKQTAMPTRQPPSPCPFCSAKHWAAECMQYRTIEARKKRAGELHLCFRCLRSGHGSKTCPRPLICYACKGGHPRAFCVVRSNPPERKDSPATGANSTPIVSGATSSHRNGGQGQRYTLLLSIFVKASDPERTRQVETMVIVDRFSQVDFVSESVARTLGLQSSTVDQIDVRGIGPHLNSYRTRRLELTIQTKDGPLQISANEIPTDHFPPITSVTLTDADLSELETVPLEAPIRTQKPGILLGTRYYHLLKIREQKQLPSGFWLSDSILGPMLDGNGQMASAIAAPICQLTLVRSDPFLPRRSDKSCLSLTMGQADEDENFYDNVNRHFEAEALDQEKSASALDAEVHAKFKKNIEFIDGRYQISLPFKDNAADDLPTNFVLARARTRSALGKLRQKPDLLVKYQQIINEQLQEGIIERAPMQPDGIVHYLPFQCVVKPDSGKIRIVFDASAKANRDSPSLNDVIHQGPTLLNNLAGLLMRFRLHPIGIVADIKGAFLQLSLRPDCRDCTRFLWPSDPANADSPLQTWRFKRLTFGINAAPFALAATINEHLDRAGSDLARKVMSDIYVDNVISGVEYPRHTFDFCIELGKLFESGGMLMREFASNDAESIARLPKELQLSGMTSGQRIKVLGTVWDTFDDLLHLPLPPKNVPGAQLTKREILSDIARPFDPLGLISPFMLEAKRFLLRIWISGKGWDDPLSSEEQREWTQLASQWRDVHPFRIPRRYFDWRPEGTNFQIHTFSDSSARSQGYGIYLRAQKGQNCTVSLVFGRSKTLKPGKELRTTAQLELDSLDSAARATDFVVKELAIHASQIQLWTDNSTAVHWLMRREAQKDVFVNNRLKRLSKWQVRHVAGATNPSDVASREMAWNKPRADWFNGPEWLALPQEDWPITRFIYDPSAEAAPKADPPFAIIGATTEQKLLIFDQPKLVTTFDQRRQPPYKTEWRKLKGVAAFVLRFLRNRLFVKWSGHNPFVEEVKQTCAGSQSANGIPPLTADELKLAEKLIIAENQRAYPPSPGRNMRSKLNDLHYETDEDGLIRCATRLAHSRVSDSAKRPYYIPRQAPIAKMIAMDAHVESGHYGTNIVLGRIRQKYWIPAARQLIKSLRCFKCQIDKARPFVRPPAPPLPASRVTASNPWTCIGVDYFGPMLTYDESSKEGRKCWAALYTCQVTRAIHIELAFDYSAEAFVSTLRRFIALRRLPEEVISDNGTNFTAAAKELQKLWRDVMRHPRIQNFAATRGIRWTFITEAAPWRGGFYERMIGTVKSSMRRSLGRWRMNWQQLSTSLYEIAAIVNERPLTVLPDDPEHFLRPIDLLRLDTEGVNTLPEVDVDPNDPEFAHRPSNTDKVLQSLGKATQKVEQFWQIWSDQYLLALRERQQRLEKGGSPHFPAEGRLVLVQDENAPRNAWRWGRIDQLITSRDGQIRTAKVKMANGRMLNRPTNLLFPLEFGDPELELTPSTQHPPLSCPAPEPDRALTPPPSTNWAPRPPSKPSKWNWAPRCPPINQPFISAFAQIAQMADVLELDIDELDQLEQEVLQNAKHPNNKSAIRPIRHPLKSTVTLVNAGCIQAPPNLSRDFRKPKMPEVARQLGTLTSADTRQDKEEHSVRPKQAVAPSRRQSPEHHRRSTSRRRRTSPRRSSSRSKHTHRHAPENRRRSAERHVSHQRRNTKPPRRRCSPPYTRRPPPRREHEPPRVEEKDYRPKRTPREWHLQTVCEGVEHSRCRQSTAREMAEFCDKPTDLPEGVLDIRLRTPLQQLLFIWALECNPRSEQLGGFAVALRREPLDAYDAWFQTIARRTFAKQQIKQSVIQMAIEWRRRTCEKAGRSFVTDPETSWVQVVEGMEAELRLPHTLSLVSSLPPRFNMQLNQARAEEAYPNTTLINCSTLFVGDSVCESFARGVLDSFFIQLRSPLQLKGLLPGTAFLGPTVKNVVLWYGTDHIHSGRDARSLIQAWQGLLEWYPYHRRIILVSPPRIICRDAYLREWEQIVTAVQLLTAKVPEIEALNGQCSGFDAQPQFADDAGNLTVQGLEDIDAKLAAKGIIITRAHPAHPEAHVRADSRDASSSQTKRRDPPMARGLPSLMNLPFVQPIQPSVKEEQLDETDDIVCLNDAPSHSLFANEGFGPPGPVRPKPKRKPKRFSGRANPESGQTTFTSTRPSLVSRLTSTLPVLLLMALAMLSSLASAQREVMPDVNWCKAAGSRLLQIPVSSPCPAAPPPTSEWVSATLDVYEPWESPIKWGAHLCTVRTDSSRYHVNVLGDWFYTNSSTEADLSAEECQMMAKLSKCMFGTLLPLPSGGHGTRHRLNLPEPSLWERLRKTELEASVTNCFAHSLAIYVDRHTFEVTVPGQLRRRPCFQHEGNCSLQTGAIVVWEPDPSTVHPCNYQQYKSNWTGQLSEQEKTWIAHDENFALTFRNLRPYATIKDCIGNLVCSDQQYCVPVLQVQRALKARRPRDLATEAELEARLMAEQIPIVKALNRTLQLLRDRECKRWAKEVRSLPDLYRRNPTGLARLLLNGTHLQATWVAARTLQISDCVPIPFHNVRWIPSGAGCFEFLPVQVQLLGQNWTGFLDPTTLILSPTARSGLCETYGVQYITSADGEAIIGIDQRTARYTRSTPAMANWAPHIQYTEYPHLQMINFHSEMHNVLDLSLSVDHTEEALRTSADVRRDEEEIGHGRRTVDGAATSLLPDPIEKAEEKVAQGLSTLRWHWLNLVGAVVTVDFGILMAAYLLQKLLDKLRTIRAFDILLGPTHEPIPLPRVRYHANRPPPPTPRARRTRSAEPEAQIETHIEAEPTPKPQWVPRWSRSYRSPTTRALGVSRTEFA